MKSAVTIAIAIPILSMACGGQVEAPSTAPSAELFTAEEDAAGSSLDLGAAAVDRPETWAFSEPSSQMRLAEAEIDGPGGPALLTVFFFGPGGGGGVEANLQRWEGQIVPDPGEEPLRDRFTVEPFTISTVEVQGTLQPSQMGAGPSEPIPGSRLLGAVIEGPGGPWFFKVTGPQETVAAARDEFIRMLRTVRVSP
jgi:hypothetical protein